jgi:hypothetical protein
VRQPVLVRLLARVELAVWARRRLALARLLEQVVLLKPVRLPV